MVDGHSILLPGATIGKGAYNHLAVALCTHYSGLPDYRTLYLSEMRMFYDAMRKSLERLTAPSS